MQILDIEQDSPEWLNERRRSIGGSDAHGILPPSRGPGAADGRSAGFWQMVGMQLTTPRELEDPRDRGHRLEEEAIIELSTIVGLKFNLKPGLWRSDTNSMLHISVDGAEPGDNPTYDAEVKALKEGKHFKYLFKRKNWKGSELDLVPDEYGAQYREQVLQAFAVNPNLQTRYFMLYEPNAIYTEHKTVLMVIQRADIAEELAEYEETITKVTNDIKSVVAELIGNNF